MTRRKRSGANLHPQTPFLPGLVTVAMSAVQSNVDRLVLLKRCISPQYFSVLCPSSSRVEEVSTIRT